MQRIRFNCLSFLGGVAAMLLFAHAANGQASTQPAVANVALVKPTERVRNCTAGGCHAAEKKYKVQHGPAAVGACDACHIYENEKEHTFKLRDKNAALCSFCHIGGGGGVGQVMHKPYQQGECLSCHNPHGGANRALLRKDNLADLCATCHGDVTQKRTHVHGPVAAGSCAACHSAHRAQYKGLLFAQGRDLCLSCHDQMNNQIKTVKFVHKPATGDCQQCHEHHASNHIMQLKQDPRDLCLSCHDNIKQTIAKAAYKHSAVTTGQACLNCHTAHGSELAKLMKDEPIKTCLTCHDKPIDEKNGRVVASLASVLDPAEHKHGPIRNNDCSGCHQPHGGPISRLLAKPYPETFYQPFELDKYSLCFSCHDKQLVLAKQAKGLTGFRNGEENLHYLHVNRPDKGRNCRACHETHASKLAFHLRESVPFGKWDMPINFKQTPTGGSCSPGCHERYAYDRDKPVKNGSASALAQQP